MSNTFSGKSEIILGLTGAVPDGDTYGRARDDWYPDLIDTWADGLSGANVLHCGYRATLTITQAAGNAELDLQTALDRLGLALALTELRVLLVYVHDNAQHDTLEISGGASNAVTSLFASVSGGKIPVGAGAKLYKSEPVIGHAVDGTHKTLKFTRISGGSPNTADLVVDVWIAGLRPA